ncbi:MAG: sulfite exporter TauE/SafE family protein [Deltaproteobacteria bacterium]|nr:MAG: sulfite exporter TauE/SafE family protein [Deltaproteobacteria bacterium]
MLSTETIYFVVLSAGFALGFGHCIGMCGPIVASLSLSMRGRKVLVPHLLYNAGRITTYGLLGGIMGVAGSFTRVVTEIASIQKGVMIFAGLLIIMLGLAMGGWIPLGRIFGEDCAPMGFLAREFGKMSETRSTVAFYPLGLLLGLLPCGPVYTALVAAARAGMEATHSLNGFIIGMSLMLCFGLGTVPALLLVAKLVDLRWLRSREIIYRISSVMMIAVGIYFVVRAIRY